MELPARSVLISAKTAHLPTEDAQPVLIQLAEISPKAANASLDSSIQAQLTAAPAQQLA